MILTGKAKEHFEAWAKENHRNEIVELPCSNENTAIWIDSVIEWRENPYMVRIVESLIIEWLDSVGIYISIIPSYDNILWYNRGFDVQIFTEQKGFIFTGMNDAYITRPKATEAAIITANKIYNDIRISKQ